MRKKKKNVTITNSQPVPSTQKGTQTQSNATPREVDSPPTMCISSVLSSQLYSIAKLWMKVLTGLTGLIFSGILSAALGFGSWAPPPFVDFVKLHTSLSILMGSILVVISLLALFLSRDQPPQDNEPAADGETRRYHRVMWYTTGISTSSLLLSFVLVSMVILQPAWCPALLCPALRLIVNPLPYYSKSILFLFRESCTIHLK